MAGIGSTNAMKKGSGNNPFLAFSEADMRSFLNSAYVGCIVKYTGDAIQREITDANRTVEEYAQNIVFKNYAFSEYGLTDGASINIFEKDSEGTVTESYIVNGAIKNGVFYYDKSSLTTPYVDVLAWVDAKANNANVKAVLYDSVYGWHHDTVNDQQMITLWSYSDDVTFTITGDLSGFELLMYIEPYKVGELYKVVYGDGEYYFEEYYYISEYKTTGNSDYIAPGKTMYDFTGELQVGNGSKVNPYIASTADEMATYLTSSYKGAFVKYTGETVAASGTPAPVNPIAVGDTVSTLYFDTTKTPDFSLLDWSNAEDVEGMTILALVNSEGLSAGQAPLHIVRLDNTLIPTLQGTMYQLQNSVADGTNLYIQCAPEDVAFCEENGITPNQWIAESNPFPFDADVVVSAVNQQDIWGAYLSKDGQWTSGGGASYVKNAVYQVAEDGDTTMYMVLPTLTNEGTASDLTPGKQLINSKGEIVVGAKDETTGDYTVKVIDYDGTVLLEKKGNTGDVIDLPTAPTHEKLVFQEWSSSVAVSDNKVTIADNDIMVGAVYTTASGQNEFDITLTKVTGLSVTLNMDGTKDWGDGTSNTETSHTYTAYGDYTIKCNGTTMTTSASSGLFGQSSSVNNYYCTAVRFTTIASVGSAAFKYCISITSIVIPNSVTSIGSQAFFNCKSLTGIVIPNSVTQIESYTVNACQTLRSLVIPSSVTNIIGYAFSSCHSLTSIVIPNGTTSIGVEMFVACYTLRSLVIPSSVTSIASQAFYNMFNIIRYDFSRHTSVPKLQTTNAFNGINALCKIIVPDSLYDEWIAASNWSTYANYIYKASEVTA